MAKLFDSSITIKSMYNSIIFRASKFSRICQVEIIQQERGVIQVNIISQFVPILTDQECEDSKHVTKCTTTISIKY